MIRSPHDHFPSLTRRAVATLIYCGFVIVLAFAVVLPAAAQSTADSAAWTIYITNDACSDYTWGFDEATTRRAFADLVNAHLDEMTRTDHEAAYNQDRYNLSITQELDAFLERYPQRKDELYRRIKEGRISVGPVYNNALWGFQSTESMIRTLYPARRLEKTLGIHIDVAEHIEHPALPWGAATILAASGFRWLSVPFLDVDSTFARLKNPPLFVWEGPDGGRLRVVMDRFASLKQGYWQGRYLLEKPERIEADWLPAYQAMQGYPARAILASGTHFDNGPTNYKQAAGYADTIIRYNAQPGAHPRLVNATLPMFFAAIDAAAPKLETLRGDFGHSWDAWPASLARYSSAERLGERRLLSAEALLATAAPNAAAMEATREDRRKAEWNWIMLADHAWNGLDDANRHVNADLRHRWSDKLDRRAGQLTQQAWQSAGLAPDRTHITLFNGLSFARSVLVSHEVPPDIGGVKWRGKPLPSQIVMEDGRRVLYFVSPTIPAYGFDTVDLGLASAARTSLSASSTSLESPRYRIGLDPRTGLVASLVDKATGREVITAEAGHALGETAYFDGREHRATEAGIEVEALGLVLARGKSHCVIDGIDVISRITVYAELDQVDFDIRVHKPLSTKEERLTQSFPVASAGASFHVDTMGVVIRPVPQPAGDLLPGADTRRFAVQGFVDAGAKDGAGATVAPLEAFVLRKDLGGITFEALGDDHDYKEATHDQDGVTDFRFRYALRPHSGAYDNAATVAWSRSVASPLLVAAGRLTKPPRSGPQLDSHRAIATAFKPAEESGRLLRIWETSGRAGPIELTAAGYREAFLTDLLERTLKPLPIQNGHIAVPLNAYGFAAVRLVP